jgi:retinol dehydrogenase 12
LFICVVFLSNFPKQLVNKCLHPIQGKVTVHALDLADFASIKSFADSVTQPINILICNAGIAVCPFGHTKQGFEQQMGVNHIGHAYLTQLLLPKLEAAGTAASPSRVVVVASLNYAIGTIEIDDLNYETRKYYGVKAYSDSKLANMLFARELANRMKAKGVHVEAVSLHPGRVMNTSLSQHMGFLGTINNFFNRWFGKTLDQGASTVVYAATTPDLPPGAYLDNCAVVEPKAHATDDVMAKALWEKTEELIAEGVKSM